MNHAFSLNSWTSFQGAGHGRGRVYDNIFVERLWRSVKYEEVYLHDYQTVAESVYGLRRYFGFYNDLRLHQSLGYRTLAEVYGVRGTAPSGGAADIRCCHCGRPTGSLRGSSVTRMSPP